MDQEEKDRKRKAWMTSAGIQVVLLLLLYFLVAWQAPDPPNPEFGIELNFGLVDSGSGNQPIANPEPTEKLEEEQVAQENTVQETTDNQDNTEVADPVETFENPDPDVVQEETQEMATQQLEENDGSDQENISETNDQIAEETNQSQGEIGESDDQGDPEGAINEDALYGTPGGGDDGSSLQMSGWEWDSPPEPEDTSQEAGKIVYEIEVDGDGYLTGYKVLTSTVSPSVVQKYTLAIQELTFSKTSSYKPARTSKGKITFIIRAK
ncbi:MAG: hypothetical protein GY816_16065 [Cytophagales bacterium]|nr:hypothetical protein [Cytophagales bacterium]